MKNYTIMSFFKGLLPALAMGFFFSSSTASKPFEQAVIPKMNYECSRASHSGNSKMRVCARSAGADKKRAHLRRIEGKSRNINHKFAKK